MKLIIAEKESMAIDITDFLCKKFNLKANNKKDYVEIFNCYYITWAKGHLLKYIEPQEYDIKYKTWNLNDLPIIPKQFKIKPLTIKQKQGRKNIELENPYVINQLKTIKELISKSDEIIHAGDADREGQLIIDEILDFLDNKKNVKRIWLHGLSYDEIEKGFKNLINNKEKQKLYLTAKLRVEIDWIFGTNLSRAMTLKFKELGLSNTFSIGRNQTPILKLLYDRKNLIQNFVPEDFYDFFISFQVGDEKIKLTLKQNTVNKKYLNSQGFINKYHFILHIVNEIKNKNLKLTFQKKILTTEKIKDLYNLSLLQEEANEKYLYSIQKTLDLTQSLYEKKLITYPRTSSNILPESDWIHLNNKLNSFFINNIIKVFNPVKRKIFSNENLLEHHAIIPLLFKKDEYEKLSNDEKNIYSMIFNRFIENLMPEKQKELIFLEYSIENTNYILTTHMNNNIFKEFSKLDLKIKENINTTKSKSYPPPFFTEGTLLNAMRFIHKYIDSKTLTKEELLKLNKILFNNSGIGTEATRAPLIEGLKNKGFIKQIYNTNNIDITEKGIELITNLNDIGLIEIISPIFTTKFENMFNQMENGKKTGLEIKVEMLDYIKKNINIIKNNKLNLNTDYYK